MPAKIDLAGKIYGRLTVEKEAGKDKFGQIMWECRCSCGKTAVVRGRDLRSGGTKSCGCWNLENSTDVIRKQTVNHSNPAYIKSNKLSASNTSGIRGVCPTKQGRWRAYIGHKGNNIYLGEFADINDAIAARKKGEEKYFVPVLEEENDCRKGV